MSISYSEHVPLTCANCGGEFSAEIWLLLDGPEQPEQTEALRQGRLNCVTCPHCNHIGPAGAPLLFHDGPARTVLFAPAPGAEEHVWREQARELHALLVERVPVEERRPYLSDVQIAQDIYGIAHILEKRLRKRPAVQPHDQPSAATSDAADAVVHPPTVSREPALAMPTAAPPDEDEVRLRDAIATLLRANSPEELDTITTAQPILLTPAADQALAQLADVAVNEREYEVAEGLRQVRMRLADMRAGGPGELPEQVPTQASAAVPPPVDIDNVPEWHTALPEFPDAAYQALLLAQTAAALEQATEIYPVLREPWVDLVLARQVDQALDEGNARLAHDLEERREALVELRQHYPLDERQAMLMREATAPAYGAAATHSEALLEEAVNALLAADDDDQMAEVLIDYPVLLTDAAQQTLERVAAAAQARGDTDLAVYADECRTMLHHVREGLEE
jgi:hypothetical protein